MNNVLAKYGFFYPVRLLRGEYVSRYLKNVRQVEKLDKEELQDYQFKKIKNLMLVAYNNIPYYNSRFKQNNINPVNIFSLKDFHKVPILTKHDIQNNVEKLKNPNIIRHLKRSTSGSTGTPLTFYKDRFATAWMDAVMYHVYTWHGIKIGYRQARFWGLPIDQNSRREANVKDFIMNRIRLSAFTLDDESLYNYYTKLKKFKPQYFYGYPSLIFEFAEFVNRNNLDISHINLKAIIGTGELVIPYQKNTMESIFNCKFVNEYGCTETGVLGFECLAGNLHIISSNIYMEVIKNGEQVFDEEGDVLVTELNSYSCSFIRYKLNDRGAISREKCTCGLNFPVLKIMSGRIDSYIETPSGNKVYDAILAYTLKKGIKSFKAVQNKIDNIDLYIIKDKEFSKELKLEYQLKLKDRINKNINFNFIEVDNIPREKSGKLRYFKSDITDEN